MLPEGLVPRCQQPLFCVFVVSQKLLARGREPGILVPFQLPDFLLDLRELRARVFRPFLPFLGLLVDCGKTLAGNRSYLYFAEIRQRNRSWRLFRLLFLRLFEGVGNDRASRLPVHRHSPFHLIGFPSQSLG